MTTFQQYPAAETPVTQILIRDRVDYLAGSILGESRERLVWPSAKDMLIGSIRRVYQSRGDEVEARRRQIKAASRWFEQCKLGDYIEISLSVTHLTESVAFYQKLGLQQVDGEETPYPWAVVSDGRLHLGLHQRSFPSPALSYLSSFPRKWRTGAAFRLSLLQMLAISPDQVEQIGTKSMLRKQKGFPIAANFQAADGQYVLLADKPFKKPSADEYALPFRNFLVKDQTFGELSLRTEDVATSVAYWQQLGFKRLAGDNKPYPWAIVSDGRVRLGLHQAARFSQPALSYFAPDMPDRLEQFRQQGLKFISTRKDAHGRDIGALIHSPDGQPILLFQGN
jgi:catechol 2,3-dioxygenase-like lactoylglutathione lyase family enzyme